LTKIIVSLAQMRIALADPKRNITTMSTLAAEAARRGSHVVVFPELWSTGYALDRSREFADTLNSGVFNQLSTVATQNKISIVGSVMEKRGQTVANSATFFAPNGRMMGVYRKIHLFRLMKEDIYLQPGESTLLMELPWGKTAMAICYDLRFPELFRRYALDGAQIVLLPSEWPIERTEHWRTLLQARAIENQYYVVATNTCGQVGDTTFAGHSMVVDPWGKILVEGGEEQGLFTVEIDLERIEQVRKRIPVFEDRRPELYDSLDLPFNLTSDSSAATRLE
jgi:predicted amidohydrolase